MAIKSSIVVLATFVAVASAAGLSETHIRHELLGPQIVPAPAPIVHLARGPIAVAQVQTGSSSQFRQEDDLGNYNFGYDETHATGATSRREEQVNGIVRGSYSLNDADGRQRIVTYIADENGFRANIQTNEPGVEPKDPADVLINKASVVAVAPVPVPLPAPLPLPIQTAIQPVPLAAPQPLPAPLQAPIAPLAGVKGLSVGPAVISPSPAIVEVPTRRAFGYRIGVGHLEAPSAPLPALQPQAPIIQQTLDDLQS